MNALLWRGGKLVENDKWAPHQVEILLRAALCDLHKIYTDQLKWSILSAEDAYTYITERANEFVIVLTETGGVVCAGEATPWFSEEAVMSEEFASHIDTDTTTAIMRALCRAADFPRFVVGTRAVLNQRHAGLAKHYQQSGLTVSTIELMGVMNE